MRIIVQQPPGMAPGHAQLICQGPLPGGGADLKVCLSSMDPGGTRYLDPSHQSADAWVSGMRWFSPRAVTSTDGGFTIELGPEVTWHLRPHNPYSVRLGGTSGDVVETRLSWPPIRLPSDAPPPAPVAPEPAAGAMDARPQEETTPKDTPEPDPDPEIAETGTGGAIEADDDEDDVLPDRELPGVTRQQPLPTNRGNSTLVVSLALLLVLLAAAGAAWWWYMENQDEAVVEETVPDGTPDSASAPDVEITLAGARRYLKENPGGEDANARAEVFDKAGIADGAFLLRSHAARQGNALAALALGKSYDPAHFVPGGIVRNADGDRAASYYEQAAKQGNLEAMTALSALLRSGQTGRTDAVEAAIFWDNAAARAREAATGDSKP